MADSCWVHVRTETVHPGNVPIWNGYTGSVCADVRVCLCCVYVCMDVDIYVHWCVGVCMCVHGDVSIYAYRCLLCCCVAVCVTGFYVDPFVLRGQASRTGSSNTQHVQYIRSEPLEGYLRCCVLCWILLYCIECMPSDRESHVTLLHRIHAIGPWVTRSVIQSQPTYRRYKMLVNYWVLPRTGTWRRQWLQRFQYLSNIQWLFPTHGYAAIQYTTIGRQYELPGSGSESMALPRGCAGHQGKRSHRHGRKVWCIGSVFHASRRHINAM